METGKLAPKADASVLVRYGDTMVLVTVATAPSEKAEDFLPLRVDYEEKLYAGGIIKSSRFMKREGRPTDESILGCRLIDRSVRPLFPKGFTDQIQLTATVLSVDGENDPQLLSLIGSSAALAASSLPWSGPIGAVYVGLDEKGEFVVNPSNKDLHDQAALKLLVTATSERVVMIEAQGREIQDEKMSEALKLAHVEAALLIPFIHEFASEVGKPKLTAKVDSFADELFLKVKSTAEAKLTKIMSTDYESDASFDALAAEVFTELFTADPGNIFLTAVAVKNALYLLRKKLMRAQILSSKTRIDGRSLTDIREISLETALLPRTHGSALFQRGLTQVLSVTTLGSSALEQLSEGMEGETTKRYLHHYNASAYASGEVGANRGPGRRDIGHGALAEKAMLAVLPDKNDFPYTIRVVSEVLSQNGSSSMGATCGSSLSLMDAGVPIKKHVSGISIGLVEEGDQFELLTDIRGLEDFNGDMDFKVAGTDLGITAIQLDVKSNGLTQAMIEGTLSRAREARISLLEKMTALIAAPRSELSKYAPKVDAIMIDPERIGEIIGSGGKVIKAIMKDTGVEINIEDDGSVVISSDSAEGIAKAKEIIEGMLKEFEIGEVYTGKVTRIMEFGAFVEMLPGREGLVHISQLSWDRVNDVRDVVKVGDTVTVKVVEIDQMGRVNLSMKAMLEKPAGYSGEQPGDEYRPRREGPRPFNGGRGGDRGPRR